MKQTLQRLGLLVLVWLCFEGMAVAEGLRFIQNKGQWEHDVLFRAEIPGGFLFLKKQSLVYVLYDGHELSARHAAHPLVDTDNRARVVSPAFIKAHGVEVRFAGSNSGAQLSRLRPDGSSYNYFIGNDPSRWASQAEGFGEVYYKNLYPGIDFRVYAYEYTIKYEFIVHPGADASRIRLDYEGADGLSLNANGQLEVKTSVGLFKEAKPYTFQEIDKRTKEIQARFALKDNQVQVVLPNDYDHAHDLTIDPELIFSTYSGSLADNWGHTATYDAQGSLYSGGTVFGVNFPVTIGAFQVLFAGQVDTGIMKFSQDGTLLMYSTFLGGNSTDIPNSLITNSKGELFIYGTTSSPNFATTGSAFQKTFGKGAGISPIDGLELPNGSDMYIARLSADGKQLLAATYLGGSGNDALSTVQNVQIRNYGDTFRGEIVLDKDENVLVVSSTNSTNFPLQNAYQSTLKGRQDATISQLSPDLSTLQWSTYFGGNAYDAAFSIKPTPDGDVYITGITQSNDLPVQTGTFQDKLKGTEDAYVARFRNQQFQQVSYLGTDAADGAYLLDLDPSGNVHVLGLTRGSYPISSGVYSNANSGQFIHALDPTLSKSLFSTVIGSKKGTPDISPTALLVNECGNIYIVGWGGSVNVRTAYNTQSSTNGMTVTEDALQRTTNGNNFYITILEAEAKSMLYATYFGSVSPTNPAEDRGDHVDGGTSRFDKNGVIYHAICACGGTRFPTTPKAWSQVNRSDNCNNAAFKIDIDRLKANFDVYEGTTKDVVQGCAPLKLDFLNTSLGGVDYIWEVNGSGISRDKIQSQYTFEKAGEYTVTLRAFNRLTCKKVDVATRKIVVKSLDVITKGDTTVCHDVPVPLSAKGGTEYSWTPILGLDNPKSATPTAQVKETTEFNVEIKDPAFGCVVNKKVKVTIDDSKPDFLAGTNATICPGQSAPLTASGGATRYRWLADPTLSDSVGNKVTAKPIVTTTYTVEAEYGDGCKPRKTVIITVENNKPDFNVSPALLVCAGTQTELRASGSATQFVWKGDSTLNPTMGPVVKVSPSYTTTYTVQAQYADGCKPEKQVVVTVDRNHEPIFDIAQAVEACNEPVKYQFINRTQSADRYEWNMGTGPMLTTNDVKDRSFDRPGEYVVTLTAYNKAGCALTVSKTLNAAPPLILPNVITPNGDGKNDAFVIPVSGSSLQVYNRWGKQVFQASDYQNNWGESIANGTYFYEIVTPQGSRCKGWVQVLE
jgi:gliding motility-associated-like protein